VVTQYRKCFAQFSMVTGVAFCNDLLIIDAPADPCPFSFTLSARRAFFSARSLSVDIRPGP
jgi:hypothetical protein